MTTMESDLKAQLDAVLDRLNAERHVTDPGRQSLQRWFLETLETERRGWKGRLKDAARAADVEHRQMLAAHAAIQQVIGHMVNRLPASSVAEVSDSMSRASSSSAPVGAEINDADATDRKVDRLAQLDRYWTAVDRYINHLESERAACLRVLKIADDGGEDAVNMAAELQGRLGDMEKEAARKALVSTLTTENGELRDRLRSIVRSERVAKERHDREVSDLKKTIMTLEQHLLKQTELIEKLSTSPIVAPRHDKAVQTDLVRRVLAASRSLPTAATAGPVAAVRTSLGTNYVSTPHLAVAHHDNQMSDDVTVGALLSEQPIGNGLLPSIHGSHQQHQHQQSQQHESSVQNGEDFYRKLSVTITHHNSSSNAASSSPSLPPLAASSNGSHDATATTGAGSGSGTVAAVGKRPSVQMQTMAVVLPNIVTSSAGDAMGINGGDRLDWGAYSPTYLRGQVLNFASKLEETKREVDACHRELVRLKATAFGSSQSDFHHIKQVVNEVQRKQRHQRQTLAAKSVTTLHLPPVDQLSNSPRSVRGENESSRATESTWRAGEIDNDMHYVMYARRVKNGKHWRS